MIVHLTDKAGRFAFPDPGEPWAVVVRADAGFVLAEFPVERRDIGTLRLERWASVRGRFRDEGRPIRGARVVRPGLNVVIQGSTSATSSSPRVIAWSSLACLPDDPRKMRGLFMRDS
jgi:hypothetical protein